MEYVVGWLVAAASVALVGYWRGHSLQRCLFFGLLCGVLALPFVLLIAPSAEDVARRRRAQGLRVCAACRSWVPAEASVCAHCRAALGELQRV